jgi:multidrug resistance efflux pump
VFAGEVKPRHEADLGFRIGGKIDRAQRRRRRAREEGSSRSRASILPTSASQAEAAKAQVAATETEFQFAQAEYERYQNLFSEKFISASALDAKRNTLDANRAKYEQARGEPRRVAEPGELRGLVRHEDGVVTTVNAEPARS